MYELRALPLSPGVLIAVLGSWRPRVEKSWFTVSLELLLAIREVEGCCTQRAQAR